MPAQKRTGADKIAKDNSKKQKKEETREPSAQELMLMMQTVLASLAPQRPLEAPAVASAVAPAVVPVVAQNNEVPAQPARAVTRSRRGKAAVNPAVVPVMNQQQNNDEPKQDGAKFAERKEQLMKQAKAFFEAVVWALLAAAKWTFNKIIFPNLFTIICVIAMYVYIQTEFNNTIKHKPTEDIIFTHDDLVTIVY